MVTTQAFNGAGDTWTPTWINFVCSWLLQIPLAYYLAFHTSMDIRGVFAAVAISQTAVAVTGVLMFLRGTWKTKNI